MATATYQVGSEVASRARQTLGTSEGAIYQMVAEALQENQDGRVLVDVGCGTGQLWSYVGAQFSRYIGIDAVRYDEFAENAEFYLVDLDTGRAALPDECADVTVAVETIEHLENPRGFMRELVRLVKPGGLVIVTTPNQLSLLSLLTLIFKKRFASFQDVQYPAHLTALLEVDLERIAAECGLRDVRINYSRRGRIVFTPWHYPQFLARAFPRSLSDNLMMVARKSSKQD
jgi:2-polyprenyl-3-methyl-5-hydroxy-6-metoxy-1,4-benzoquinol methylase